MASSSSQKVTKGGLWDSKTPAYSKETQDLLKVMMQESKLTSFQQKQLTNSIQGGGTLPLRCNPTSSANAPRKVKSSKPKELKLSSGSGLRTKETIEATGAYERPKYRPNYTKSNEKDKQRLQNIMAFGKDIPEPTPEERAAILRVPSPEPDIDRFEELQAEIEERAQFLEDMKAMGREKEYASIISTEISQKIREMELIDADRTKALKQAVAEQERSAKQEEK
ncbi:UPF0193 protein EVG1-like [Holothuria leucospilota]|uniref:UPF0193 protein EVG1-like n=1 Tax=Holothuria leucospilota TaxID=206669 RepID=A0A9Q1C1T8_HOLLE|nr:UPF0193 protein EVG1-like [Holothuria leucospilota]